MSIKAKIVLLLKYGGSWLIFFVLQIFLGLWLHYSTRGSVRKILLGIWGFFLLAYLLIPLDYFLGLTLPVSLYRAIVLPSIVWQTASIPAFLLAAALRRKTPQFSLRQILPVLAVFIAFAGIGTAGVLQAFAPPAVRTVHLRLAGLHGKITILHITDMHTGYFQSASDIQRIRALLPEEPDFIVLTGDQLHGAHAPFVRFLHQGLGRLTAKQGKFQVAGNHDHRTGVRTLYETLAPLGFTPLHNAHVLLQTGAGPLALAGIDDTQYGGNLAAALEGIPPGIPIVLLSHRPDVLPQAAAAGVSLVLSGHTHGGQICLFSWLCLSDIESRYRRGEYRMNATRLLVSSGTGTTGLPLRLFSPPEINWIVLEGP